MGEYAAAIRLCIITGTKQAKACAFSWGHLRQLICGVGKICNKQRVCIWQSAELSGIVPWLSTRVMENMFTSVTSSTKKAPQR